MNARVLIASSVLFFASSAYAQENGGAASAEQLFTDARRLMKMGAYAEACPKLAESQRLDPGIGTLFNLADCHEHVGKTATAWGEFLDVAGQAKASGQSAREGAARARASALEPRLARLTIFVRGADEGLVLSRDGAEIGRAQWNTAIPIDPGPHTVSARAPNKEAWHRTVTAIAAQTTPVEVPPLDPAPQPTPPPAQAQRAPEAAPPRPSSEPVAPPIQDSPRKPNRAPAIVAFSAAAIGAGVGTAFGFISKTKHDDAAVHCNGNFCDQSGVQLREDARRAGTISTIAFVAGGVALAGGVVLWLTATPPSSSGTASIGVQGVW